MRRSLTRPRSRRAPDGWSASVARWEPDRGVQRRRFAFAITLLVIDIQVRRSDFTHLWSGIGHQWPSYLGYATSFLTVERQIGRRDVGHYEPQGARIGGDRPHEDMILQAMRCGGRTGAAATGARVFLDGVLDEEGGRFPDCERSTIRPGVFRFG